MIQTYHGQYKMPPRIAEGLAQYAREGREPGSFLRAVLSNNLLQAITRADLESLACLHDIVLFVCNELPARSWGSSAAVHEWIRCHDTAREAAAPKIRISE